MKQTTDINSIDYKMYSGSSGFDIVYISVYNSIKARASKKYQLEVLDVYVSQ